MIRVGREMLNQISTVWLLAVAMASVTGGNEAADFRRSNWGDTSQQVLSAETATFHHQREDELAFTDSSIEGIDGGVIYLFERDRLVRGLYVSRNEYLEGAGVLEDYSRMQEYFQELLGVEFEEARRWLTDAPRIEPEDVSGELARNLVRVSTSWRLERTQVDLIMSGRDGGVFLRAVVQPSR